MSSDSRLQTLQRSLEDVHRSQSDARKEVERLQKSRDTKLEQIRRDYDNDISIQERKYKAASERLPDITRQIETRQREIETEQRKTAAKTNSAPDKKTGWM
jgi:predicted  nucleic acid-binding Zn-ribbon protein